MAADEPFLNPYTFIPAFPRNDLPEELRCHAPDGHERLRDGWTGRIAVTLTVETPLLLLDTTRATPLSVGGKEHRVYPVQVRGGRPYLPATSVKGMLRSAYEAVTNSRFGVFTGHDTPLGFRRTAAFALDLVPVQVSSGGRLRVFKQAVIRMYDEFGKCRYPDEQGRDPRHMMLVRAVVSTNKNNADQVDDFAPLKSDRRLTVGRGQRLVRGGLCITGPSIEGKKNERLFYVEDGEEPEFLQLAVPWEKLAADWEALILNYRNAHSTADIFDRVGPDGRPAGPGERLGDGPGQLAWSRHLYDDRWTKLSPGTLCYALRDLRDRQNPKVTRLYPVLVPRDLYSVSPADLLDPSLRPATCYRELSPADRVFGWVAPEGTGVRSAAYKGRLRIGPVTCNDDVATAVRRFEGDGLPLAILSRPKPQQGRFYLSESARRPDRPVPDGTPKEDLYRAGRGLRGRKAYWHHAGLDADRHWDPAGDGGDPTQIPLKGRYREYLRPHSPVTDEKTPTRGKRRQATPETDQRDSQNRSIKGWVNPGTAFRFTIEVRDLDDIELGALAWLLTLPEDRFHRLGFGRPLGFGSVRLAIDPGDTTLHSAAEYASYYRSLTGGLPKTDGLQMLDSAAEKFTRMVDGTHSLSVIRDAFLAVARGNRNMPVHYPRIRSEKSSAGAPTPPDPSGENFRWFTLNEKTGKDAPRRAGRSLPSATDSGDPLTVYEPVTKRSSSSGGRGNGRNGGNRRRRR